MKFIKIEALILLLLLINLYLCSFDLDTKKGADSVKNANGIEKYIEMMMEDTKWAY